MNRTNTILLCLGTFAVGAAANCSQEGPGAGNPNATATSSTTGAAGDRPSGTGSATSTTSSTTTSSTTTSGTGGDPSGGTGGAGPGAGGMGTTTTTGSGGAGGTTGTGGGGGTGSGGKGGAGGGGMLTPADILPTLVNYYWEGTCAGNSAEVGRDCRLLDDNMQCPNSDPATPYSMRGAFKHATHKVGGTVGQKYMVNFDVRGVAGGKFYSGGTLRTPAGYTDGPAGNDGWYEGGNPTDSKWNTYELHVTPAVPGAPNVYYLNAFPTASGYDGRHETFVIKFSASFPVLGGGTISLVIHDSNCLGQQNCGQNLDATCTAPRTGVDINGLVPPPGFTQPPKNVIAGATYYPQWLLFHVTSVTSQ